MQALQGVRAVSKDGVNREKIGDASIGSSEKNPQIKTG
jgi:hypothetical protein